MWPIRSFLRIWSYLLKKSLMKNVIFCAVVFKIFWSSNSWHERFMHEMSNISSICFFGHRNILCSFSMHFVKIVICLISSGKELQIWGPRTLKEWLAYFVVLQIWTNRHISYAFLEKINKRFLSWSSGLYHLILWKFPLQELLNV